MLAEYLDQVVDHRSRQGLRYEMGFLLGVVVAATACTGHAEVAAQAQWAADAPQWVLTALGAQPDPLTGRVSALSESTLRRTLARVDAADLHRRTVQWAQAIRGSHHDNDNGNSDGRTKQKGHSLVLLEASRQGGRSVADHLAASGHPVPDQDLGALEAASRALGWDGGVLAELTLLGCRIVPVACLCEDVHPEPRDQ